MRFNSFTHSACVMVRPKRASKWIWSSTPPTRMGGQSSCLEPRRDTSGGFREWVCRAGAGDGLWWRRRDECKRRKGIVACGKHARPERMCQREGEACECDSIIRRCGESGIASVCKQSQRDCVLQPKVARNELPWVIVQHGINRNAVAAILFSFGGRVTLATTPLGL